MPANTLTAEEFAAQGTTPGVVLSLAGYYVRELNDHATAAKLRTIAREVSWITGIALPKRRKRKHHNDNGKPRNSERLVQRDRHSGYWRPKRGAA